MEKQQLLQLRDKIVQSAQEIALRGEGSPVERLQVLLDIIRSGTASLDVLTKAYELTQTIQGDDDKLSALLDLLYEVDAKLGQSEEATEPVNEPQRIQVESENTEQSSEQQ